MKRLKFHRAIVAIAMMLIGWLPSLAHDFEVDGIFYNVISTTEVEVTYKGDYIGSYSNEYSGDIVIPSSVNYTSSVNYNGTTYSVTSIGDLAFYECTSLTSVVIGNSVTSIGEFAFYNCESMTSIEIPNSVTSIGYGAFEFCDSLTSIEIPDSVTSIGEGAFSNCSSLTSIEIPNSVTIIGDFAFRGCSSMTSIEIPNSVTSIGKYAFKGCSSLTSIEIPNSVTSIGYGAFEYCSSLTSIEIPNSVTSIGNAAFSYCDSLTSVEIPNSVTSIGYYAFSDCYSLTKITCLATNPPTIGSGTFSNYSAELYVPVGCISAYQSANYWRNFNNIIEIGSEGATFEYEGLTYKVIVKGEELAVIASKSGKYSGVVVIPSSVNYNGATYSVTSIGDSAFSNYKNLTSIEIPNSVTSIGEYAFLGCSSLTSIRIPNSVISIGYATFAYCSSLISIEIPNSVTSIGDVTFEGCSSLTDAVIGNSVTSIGWHAFYDCSSLTKITCWATTPPTIESGTFSNYSAELHVPFGYKSAYQSANYWKYFNIKEIVTLSTSIALNQTTATLKATETITLVATVLPENATDKSVTWMSSNESVATVDANGKVTAVAIGEATITATTIDSSNLSASCKVTVVPTLAVSIELNQTEASVEEKTDLQLTATILPEHTTNKEVAWSSSDIQVASVDNTGLVTIHSAGEVIITATTTDGSNLSATCRINVYSGINGVNGDDVIVATVGDNIVVKNAKLGSVVNVYSSNGALIKSMTATDGSVVIEAPIKGIYVIAIDGKSFKVMVK